MYEISCEMCLDLMPLVKDGVASEDSVMAVEGHLAGCEECRVAFGGELPEGDEKTGLRKAMKQVRTMVRIVVWLLVALGILLCELVMQGSSYFFALAVLVIWLLVRIGLNKGTKKWGKIIRSAALLAATAMILGIGSCANEMYGNPIAKKEAERKSQAYLDEFFGDRDLYIEDISYNMSATAYDVRVKSRSSADTWFDLVWRDGELIHESYEYRVLDKGNTATRINKEYGEKAEKALKLLNLKYDVMLEHGQIDFAWENLEAPEYALRQENLILDGDYDVMELGAQAGHLSVWIRDAEVTEERAAEILLDIRKTMEEQKVRFYVLDFELRYPPQSEEQYKMAQGEVFETVRLENFLYEDIYEEGLMERVREANLQ